jgi:hypothetical protein
VLWRATLAWQREMRTALAPHGLTHVQFVLLAVTREGREKLRSALSDVEAADARFFTDPAGVVAALGEEALRPR